MHPYTVANMVASLGRMYGRRTMLNMVAGGFATDLAALNDQTPHDDRYVRLVEYTTIIQELLARSSSKKPLSFEGKYYRVKNLTLTPALSPELQPGVFMSGSSDSGLAAARAVNALAVQYPTPPDEFGNVSLDRKLDYGIRIGIIARDNEDDAWTIAEERFPSDRTGNLTRQLTAKVSDSHWHKNLMEQVGKSSGGREPYWLVPFQNYKTMCPYLVGNYDGVAAHVQTYLDKGYDTIIMDIPPSLEELEHSAEVFKRCESAA
jgi:alkanesulfonate monooxygenase